MRAAPKPRPWHENLKIKRGKISTALFLTLTLLKESTQSPLTEIGSV